MQAFSERLREAMLLAGYASSRTPSGVDIHKLTEITGYSSQICRKYLRGEALPEPTKLMDIATALDTSPGWLLFGEKDTAHLPPENHLMLSKTLLHYLLTHAAPLYQAEPSNPEIPLFLTSLAEDISQIHATEAQSRQIIDLALASATRFKHIKSA